MSGASEHLDDDAGPARRAGGDAAYVGACLAQGGFRVMPTREELARAGAVITPPARPPEAHQEPPPLQLEAPRVKRPVKALALASLRGVAPAIAPVDEPRFEKVDPAALLVDEVYQRQLSERSISLIRKIVGAWDWRRFKPPVVARTDAGLEVIDGQHTAIAAASHPDVREIWVMVVEAAEQADRAGAFIGHNRDRLNISSMQIHFAAAAAGDPQALAVARVCAAAGVRILRSTPAGGAFKVGDTVSVKAIATLLARRGEEATLQVLTALAGARLAPIGVGHIKAVEMLFHEPEYAGQVSPADVTAAFLALGTQAETEAQLFATAHKAPLWRALGVILFRRATRGRRRSA